MIYFDTKTGKFRDSDTGRLRSDISGLLSSNARRQYREFAGNIDVKEYRRKLGQKNYVAPSYTQSKEKTNFRNEPTKRKKEYEETSIKNYDDYISDWLEDFDFILDEDDTDLETP